MYDVFQVAAEEGCHLRGAELSGLVRATLLAMLEEHHTGAHGWGWGVFVCWYRGWERCPVLVAMLEGHHTGEGPQENGGFVCYLGWRKGASRVGVLPCWACWRGTTGVWGVGLSVRGERGDEVGCWGSGHAALAGVQSWMACRPAVAVRGADCVCAALHPLLASGAQATSAGATASGGWSSFTSAPKPTCAARPVPCRPGVKAPRSINRHSFR